MQDATALGEFRQDLPDGDGPGRLVAMNAAHHQQARARAQRMVLVDLDDARGAGFGGLGGVGERVGHGESGGNREKGRDGSLRQPSGLTSRARLASGRF